MNNTTSRQIVDIIIALSEEVKSATWNRQIVQVDNLLLAIADEDEEVKEPSVEDNFGRSYCSVCGASVYKNHIYCHKCGVKLRRNNE